MICSYIFHIDISDQYNDHIVIKIMCTLILHYTNKVWFPMKRLALSTSLLALFASKHGNPTKAKGNTGIPNKHFSNHQFFLHLNCMNFVPSASSHFLAHY